MLTLLDLSAAFDTHDHKTLLHASSRGVAWRQRHRAQMVHFVSQRSIAVCSLWVNIIASKGRPVRCPARACLGTDPLPALYRRDGKDMAKTDVLWCASSRRQRQNPDEHFRMAPTLFSSSGLFEIRVCILTKTCHITTNCFLLLQHQAICQSTRRAVAHRVTGHSTTGLR